MANTVSAATLQTQELQGAREKKESFFTQSFKRLLKNKAATVALIALLILVLLAIFAPLITPYQYDEMDYYAINSAPSLKHWFGTDSLGRDLLSRLLYGGRYSLSLGFAASFLSSAVAVVIGSVAGYYGGRVDNIILRICDVVQAIPGMLLAIVLSTLLGNGYFNTILALAIGGIPSSVRMTRSMTMSVRGNEYLEAAQSINCSSSRIMFRHILPNILSPLIVGMTMGMSSVIMLAASLSFLGLGVQPPLPEWGAMLSAGRNYISNYPWLTIFPGIFIFITCLSINIFGDGLRDAMDPKLKD
ncbi:MAG: ABC transporter permease [Lachnospiraceae bacterium]|nr:ABC transporter permease [Lachnospiraceae bacterium]